MNSHRQSKSASTTESSAHKLSNILHSEVANLAINLKNAGLSPQNCMVVIRVGRKFFVSASGIAASDHAMAIEDFAQMLRASFDDDHQVIDFLDKIKGNLTKSLKKDQENYVAQTS